MATLTLENFNPDCMNIGELREFEERFGVRVRGQAEAFAFTGRTYDEARTVLFQIGRYCGIKAKAMRARINGEICVAVELEDLCDGIYERLPDWAQW